MKTYVGTSGFSYDGWRGTFYPEKIKASDMLAFFSSKLGTVELNNTFYRFPTAKLFQGWRAAVPETFRFSVKANMRFSNPAKINDVAALVSSWHGVVTELGPTLGPTLIQFARYVKKDMKLLLPMLEALPRDRQHAFDFVHDSWLDSEVYEALRSVGAALCISENEDGLTPFELTGSFNYIRLRKILYSDAELAAWAQKIRAAGRDTYVFFKHEDKGIGPKMAEQFQSLVAS